MAKLLHIFYHKEGTFSLLCQQVQLITVSGKNHYYLKHLAPDVRLYTFVESTKKLYKYTPKGVEIASFTRTKNTRKRTS